MRCGGRLADTRLASLEAKKLCRIPKEDRSHLPGVGRLFRAVPFNGALTGETGARCEAVEEENQQTRYASYLAMYEEASAEGVGENEQARRYPCPPCRWRRPRSYVQPGDFIIACDGAGRNAARLGLQPDLIVGGADSAPRLARRPSFCPM